MKTAVTVVVASLALTMGVLIAPGAVLGGQQAQGAQNTGLVVGGATLGTSRSVALPFPEHSFVSRSFVRPFVRPVFPFAAAANAPSIVYASPLVYYPPPVYYDPPASYSAPVNYTGPMSYAPPPSPTVSVAPTPNVVQFSTGRYELRGDGMSVPYAWVWIPYPPTAPPSGTTPEPTSGKSSAPRRSQLYRWTDADGAMHWTDRLESVPEKYRSQAASSS